ncbi:WD40 repeat-like protein [Jaminaea rosea]|uniref:WD40 repeat-like protein n=1 Tax=Jaminaea rosea TaxID=1569628 RepID=A0A316V0N4_9BASI|nr:WD40 repeat-like protein [Jaminaea rosea]PWN31109.1 WD40 repeat-like protein [Jaminaea rosea]
MPISPPTPAPSPRPRPAHFNAHEGHDPAGGAGSGGAAYSDHLESSEQLVSPLSGSGSNPPWSSSAHIDPQSLTRAATALLPTLAPSARLTLISDLLMLLSSRELAQISTFIASRLRIDFLSALPIEVSLQVLSFIDDPATLARCSQVSRFWRSLVNDEHTWEAMCLKYRYRYRRPSSVYPRVAAAAGADSSASSSKSKRSRAGPPASTSESLFLASLYRRYRERGLDPVKARDELRALHDLFLAKQQQQQQQQQQENDGASSADLSARFYEQLDQILMAENLAAAQEQGSRAQPSSSSSQQRRPSTSSDPTAAASSASRGLGWLSTGHPSSQPPANPAVSPTARSRLPILTGVGANPGFLERYGSTSTSGPTLSWASGLGLPWGLGEYIHLPAALNRVNGSGSASNPPVDVTGGMRFANGSNDSSHADNENAERDDVMVAGPNASRSANVASHSLGLGRSSSSGELRSRSSLNSSTMGLGMSRPDSQPSGSVPRSATYTHGMPPPAEAQPQQPHPFSYKAHFKRNYLTESNWHRGGHLLTHHVSTESGSVCTCMAMDERWLVVGMANGKIHLFDARSGEFERTLQGRHESGVWCLALVSKTRGAKKKQRKGKGKAKTAETQSTSSSSDAAMGASTGDASYRTAQSNPSSPHVADEAEDVDMHHDDDDDDDGAESDSSTSTSSSSSTPYEGFSMGIGGSALGNGTLCSSTRGFGNETALLISGGCDRELKVWDLSTGQILHSLRGHHSTVRCLRVLEGRPVAVSGGRDSTVRVWDVEKGEGLRVLAGHINSVRCLEVAGNKVASGSYDCTCRIWDVDTGECLHVLRGHYNQIYCIGFDGLRVATGSLDSTVRVWDAVSGEPIALLQGHTMLVGQLQLVNGILISGGSDGRIIAYSIGGAVPGRGATSAAAGGRALASAPPTTTSWPPGATSSTTNTSSRYPTRLPPSAIADVRPGSTTAASPSLGSSTATSVQALYAICAHDNSISCIQFDEHFVLTGGNDGTVRLWNLHDGSFVRELVGPAATMFAAPAAGGTGGAASTMAGGATSAQVSGENAETRTPVDLRMESVWKLGFRDDRVVWVARRGDEAMVMGIVDFRPSKVEGGESTTATPGNEDEAMIS